MKGIAVNPSIDDAKHMARRLRAAMETRGLAATHSDTLELVAAQLGFRDWNTTSAALNAHGSGGPHFVRPVPVMLSLDEAKCREFYCDFLGFEIEFEHRFARTCRSTWASGAGRSNCISHPIAATRRRDPRYSCG